MSTLPNVMFVYCATTEMRTLSQGFPDWKCSTVDIIVHCACNPLFPSLSPWKVVFYETSPPPCLCLHQWRPRSQNLELRVEEVDVMVVVVAVVDGGKLDHYVKEKEHAVSLQPFFLLHCL